MKYDVMEWAFYEAQNRRAAREYERCPSIVPTIAASLQSVGLGRTARSLNTTPSALFAWFPDLIERCDGGDRFKMRPAEADAS